MIDIHSHIIFDVDDGSPDVLSSLKMIELAANDGVTDIICTPHFRRNVFEPDKRTITENFSVLKERNTFPVNLYLGQEIAKCRGMFSMLNNGELLTMNGTKYVLLEFRYVEETDIEETVCDAVYFGYIPIIAHVERYEYVKEKDIERFIDRGALIQVNADSLVLKRGARYKSRVLKYIKHDLVDIVANDMHYSREYCMKKAYEFVKKKFGEQKAEDLFVNNAKEIIGK